jgi:hypothetical protein
MQRAGVSADRSADRIERRFRQTDQRLSRVFTGMQRTAIGAFGAMGVAISGIGMARLVQDALAVAESIRDVSDRVGFATDRLQELRYAADQNGSSARTLDMALQRFSRRVAEAAQGSGELRNDLLRLNIPLRDANGNLRDSYDILLDYADGMRNAGSEQEALRLAFKAFDSEGAQLVSLMRQGREGISSFGEAARNAGVVLEDSLVRQGAEANAQLRAMRQSVGSRVNAEILEHADALMNIAEALGEIARWAIQATAAMGRFLDRMDRTQAGTIALNPQSLDEVASEMERARALGETLARVRANRPIGGAVSTQIRNTLGVDALQSEGIAVGAGSRLTQAQIQTLSQMVDVRINRLEGLQASLNNQRLRIGMERRRAASSDQGGGAGSGGLSGQDAFDRNNWGLNVQPSIAPRYERDARRAEQEAEMQAAKDAALAEFRQSLKDAHYEALRQNRERFADEFGHSFAEGITAAFDGNLQEYLARRLRQAAYDGLYDVFRQLGEMLFNRMQGNGGTGTASMLTAAAQTFAGFFASGGNMRPGQYGYVGESGMEKVTAMPGGGVKIQPLSSRSAASGGVSVVNHIRVDAQGAISAAEVEARVGQAVRTANRHTEAALRGLPGRSTQASLLNDGVRMP